ncbi:MAG: WYL domain-containing protein, partial [Rubellimicrobium sp.]|nr:WYL domain-containing protein [Rubellimicrobium sp.]
LHILGMGVRQLDPLLFRTVASALGSRLRLAMHYCSRSRDEATERTVSPQRLVFYRDNWYLDAWCHLRDDARIFALDRIRGTEVTPEPAIDLDEDGLDTRLEDSYGIFHGEAQATALLRFSARMSRWVSEATWRPEQQGRWAGAGDYELEVPYSDPTELIRDILSYGPDVEVVHPAELREQVTAGPCGGDGQQHRRPRARRQGGGRFHDHAGCGDRPADPVQRPAADGDRRSLPA